MSDLLELKPDLIVASDFMSREQLTHLETLAPLSWFLGNNFGLSSKLHECNSHVMIKIEERSRTAIRLPVQHFLGGNPQPKPENNPQEVNLGGLFSFA